MVGLVAGDHDKGIVGGGIAIDGDAVERAISQLTRQLCHHALADTRVGGQKAQHGGHVRADHAGTLADAGDVDASTADFCRGTVGLGQGIGGHDAFGGHGPLVRRGCGDRIRQFGDDAIHRQRLHDHAGRERQDLLRLHAKLCRHGIAGLARMLQAAGTGTGVGIAGVDHQCANGRVVGRQMFAADLHRCGAIAVLRKYGTNAGTLVQQDHGQVLAVGLAHTGFGHAQTHAGDRMQIFGTGGLELYGHGSSCKKEGKISSACRGTACTSCHCRRGRDRCDRLQPGPRAAASRLHPAAHRRSAAARRIHRAKCR